MKIAELRTGPKETPQDQRLALEELERKINELIRALNELLEGE